MKIKLFVAGALLALASALPAQAATEHYNIDIKGQHAFIQFKVKHLGFSWILGSFRKFDGSFDYDADNAKHNKVSVTIDTASLDTNHALRNKHLRSDWFFDTTKYPTATFVSTSYDDLGNSHALLHGKLTLRGITKNIVIKLHQIGAGKDPWGEFRRGFEGTTTLHLSDYNMKKAAMLGPVSENIELYLSIEGVKQ
ncbi:MAG: YceI family protein [Mariprofundales bacterium]|nr:YceI family protein [Mariprofundales bacterium]